MEMTTNQRVAAILEDKEISNTKFAKLLQMEPSTVIRQVAGRSAMSAELLTKMLMVSEFADVSAEYILRGVQHLLAPFDRYKSAKDYLHHLNDSLKALHGKDGKPIEPKLSSNWARHTWATLCADIDIPDPTITLGMGHSTAGHKTTAIYIKRDMSKVDEANRKVIDYLWAD